MGVGLLGSTAYSSTLGGLQCWAAPWLGILLLLGSALVSPGCEDPLSWGVGERADQGQLVAICQAIACWASESCSLTGQVSPLSLSAPCASLSKLRALSKRTHLPGRKGTGSRAP